MTKSKPIEPCVHEVGLIGQKPGINWRKRLERTKEVFLGPSQDPPARSDNVLDKNIMRALRADRVLGRGDIAQMHVLIRGGIATLTGHVGRSIHKARAEAAIRALPGVAGVVNYLVADDDLILDVAQALGRDAHTQAEQIQVNARHGVVYLGGAVIRAPVRTAAAQIAARIPQTRGIINGIRSPGLVIEAAEEQFVQPAIASEIYASDGQVRHVQQVVIDPQNRRVTAVVADMHPTVPRDEEGKRLSTEALPPQHRILIPIGNIRHSSNGTLFLKVKRDEIVAFAEFNMLTLGTPPAEWQPPYPYRQADVLFC